MCVWLVLRCGLSRRLYSFYKMAVDMCVYVHFWCKCVRGVCCLYSRSACSSPQAPWASGSLGGLAHTELCVCLCVSVCVFFCVVFWRLRKIQIVLWAGPQRNPSPHPLLQCTTFKYLTTTLYWLLLHTHVSLFLCTPSVLS